jgi:peptidyl-tRNA hydrolase
MQSVIDALGTEKIARVRVGIGRPPSSPPSQALPAGRQGGVGGGSIPLDVWVLNPWTEEEKTKLPEIFSKAADEVEKLL